MKPVLLSAAVVALAAVGCSSVDEVPPDTVEDKLTKLEVQMTAKLDKAHAVFTELTDNYMRLQRRVGDLESENKMLQIEVKRLNDKVELAGAASPRTEGPQGQAPGPDMAEVGMRIDQALAKLKTTGNVDEAAKELVPLSRYSAVKMTEGLKQITLPDYVADLEKVLAKCSPLDLKTPLEEALKDRARRSSVARVVGGTRDPGLSRILEPHASDADPVVQVEMGQALVACRNKAGVPPLLKALAAPESEIRFQAILSLKRLNKGQAFGYDMNRGADENAAALKSWQEWWQKEGPKLFE